VGQIDLAATEQAHMQLRGEGAGGLLLVEDQAAPAHVHFPA
jgi:hypothetical protein